MSVRCVDAHTGALVAAASLFCFRLLCRLRSHSLAQILHVLVVSIHHLQLLLLLIQRCLRLHRRRLLINTSLMAATAAAAAEATRIGHLIIRIRSTRRCGRTFHVTFMPIRHATRSSRNALHPSVGACACGRARSPYAIAIAPRQSTAHDRTRPH